MLVLSRKIGEVITVGTQVKITILSFDRGVVRLGIEAPKSIPVHRKEVHDKIIEMNRNAAKTELAALKLAMSKTGMSFMKKNEPEIIAPSVKLGNVLNKKSKKDTKTI
ncbi:MAG: carbon storage regulator CsrA [Candidatus Kapabacteria bacterium]|nr:carbon storage regulator CsrA [Candidatus Kapabacteria bacterium]